MVKRVRHFETNDRGEAQLLAGQALMRNASYEQIPKRSHVAGRLQERNAVAAWVRDAVIGDLKTLDQGIAQRADATATGEGNFLLLVGCMMAIEYFGTIFDTSARTVDRVVAYAREFMSNRYAECMPLLMAAARNGIAHGSWPARVRVGDAEYPFAVGYNAPASCEHLRLSLHPADDNPAGKLALFVNPRTMLADLSDSVIREPGGFREWILSRSEDDDAITRRAQPVAIEWRDTDLSEWK